MYIKRALFLIVAIGFICSCKKGDQETPGPPAVALAFSPASTTTVADFKGVNWADARDNFADDELVLSGTSATDSYASIQTKAIAILTGFKNAGANTIRLPVNPATALGSWWHQYKGTIDKALEMGMKVMIAYWEGTSSKDGIVDNSFAYWKMWDTVVTNYKTKGNIYFELMNEPHGYGLTALNSLYASFISRYPGLPKGRIVLDGAGYSTDVNSVGNDNRFDSCLLSFHFYTWFDNRRQTTADWEQPVKSLSFPQRTIVTEFGVPMTGLKDYLSAPGSDAEITYLQGMTNAIHDLNIGGIYWPGLRSNDSYSMFTLTGSSLITTNASGLSRLKYAWHGAEITQPYGSFASGINYRMINENSGKSLDVNNSDLDDGGIVTQSDYLAGNNQRWQLNSLGNGYFSIVNKNSSKLLDVDGASKDAGKNIVQWTGNSSTNQQWQVIDIGFGFYKIINKNSGLALDINGKSKENGASAIQWDWNSGANQQWQIAVP